MSDQPRRSLRGRLLSALFALLYSRLAGLHEVAGKVVSGPAWHGRRALVLPSPTDTAGWLLDVGSGEGRLLAMPLQSCRLALGIEPSQQMTRRARRRGATIVRGDARRLPLLDASIEHVVCTYPGPWIADAQTWAELARVTRPGARVRILLGGTTERGRGARVRGVVAALAYGNAASGAPRLPTSFGHALLPGHLEAVQDAWGTAYVWCGARTDSGSSAGCRS